MPIFESNLKIKSTTYGKQSKFILKAGGGVCLRDPILLLGEKKWNGFILFKSRVRVL